MTGPRTGRDDGVSNVLGAILMFGLLVLTLVMIQVKFVPVWTEDREARQMQTLSDDLRQLKSDLDRQAGNDTAGTITDSIAMHSTGGFQFFRGGDDLGSTATLTPSPSGTGVAVVSTNPVQILRRGGNSLFGLTDDWPDYTDGDVIENVAAVNFLRVRIEMDPLPPDDSFIQLNVYASDDDVNPIGWVIVTLVDGPSEKGMILNVFNEAGEEVSGASESFFQNAQLDYKYFDLLEPDLLFDQIIAQGLAPYRLELIETGGMAAQYQIAYTDADSGGFSGGSGLPAASFSSTRPSGKLVFEGRNEKYVDQTYILEHGAIILSQSSGSAVVAGPNLGIGLSASQGSITWTLAGLDGDGVSRGGDRVAAAASPSGTIEDVWFLASDTTITIPTLYGSAWCTYLDALFQADSWTTPAMYSVASTSANCILTLKGPIATQPAVDPGDYDVSIQFRVSQIDLTLSAG